MRWEYFVLKADTVGDFEVALNKAGGDGWEAVFGGYVIGESTKVSLGQGMPVSTKQGAPIWSAIMKRALAA